MNLVPLLALFFCLMICEPVSPAPTEVITTNDLEIAALLESLENETKPKQPKLKPYCFEYLPDKKAFKAVNCTNKHRPLPSWSTVDGTTSVFTRSHPSNAHKAKRHAKRLWKPTL